MPLDRAWKLKFAGEVLEQRPNSTFACDKDTLQSTKNEKIFVAGDASGESVIAIQALATGRRAAQSVIRFLRGEDLRSGRELKDTWTYETKLQMPVDWGCNYRSKRRYAGAESKEENLFF